MAKITKNLFLEGARGMLGNELVYRIVDGEMVVSVRPKKRQGLSEAQKEQTRRFQDAATYAKSAINDEWLGSVYAEATIRLRRYKSAYVLALTDYLRSPEIGELTVSGGTKGSTILVEAIDDPFG